jgi:aminopeptidase N
MFQKYYYILLLCFGANCGTAFSQNKAIDVLHYQFSIGLNDSNNIIQGTAAIDFKLKKSADMVYFDLTNVSDSTGKGMRITNITEDNNNLKFRQDKDHVNIYFNGPLKENDEKNISIKYEGIPADGLIIDTNKFAHRTFFADNWPNRAHNWIPCNDHPSDKALVDFIVTAPDHYQVIANGVIVEQTNLPHNLKLTHYKETMVLPTKVMVIGVADFAVQLDSTINCIPVTSWVFPENRDSGFAQYSVSKNILPFYINYISPYPFKKLANVQSKTIFGGMENAGNIFYFENSVATNEVQLQRRGPLEDLFAHETAHQWFGDEVSEKDWPHVWLSEGFATYMTQLYLEHKYGIDTLNKRMLSDRNAVLKFYKKRKTPIVDFSEPDSLMLLLNANSYEKGSWVLHMLRRKLGDEIFRRGIQTYYQTYKGSNASTDDFMHVMEKVSKQNLKLFFKQWLYTPGQPDLDVIWKYDERRKMLEITIRQTQDFVFRFPLQISIRSAAGVNFKTIEINNITTNVATPLSYKPISILLDPNVNLLFEGNIKEDQ